MSAPSHFRTSYFNQNLAAAAQLRQPRSYWERSVEESQRRIFFSGAGLSSSESTSSAMLNFATSNVNAMLQAKQELRETTCLDVSDTAAESSVGRKRRPEEEDLPLQNHMGSYMLQSSSGSIAASSQGQQTPAGTLWMVANPSNQLTGGGDHIMAGNSNLYRTSMASGLHFMNFPTPMALLPGQQLGPGGGGAVADGHLGMLAALNAFRPLLGSGSSESQASGSNPHHGGDQDRAGN